MTGIKYQSRTRTFTNGGGIETALTYQGELDDITALQNAAPIGSVTEDGRLASSVLKQLEGPLWGLEVKYVAGPDLDIVSGPDQTAYGVKSASLRGGRLNLPLEKIGFANGSNKYRMKWNHYLFGLSASMSDALEIPAFWDTASDDSDTHGSNMYRWGESASELPTDKNDFGNRWKILKSPTKPGVTGFDVSTYVVTESARFKTTKAAGAFCAGKLNKIGAPSECFGLTGGNWKCDDASVSWNGTAWIATLTWTKSVDNGGWDTDLYENV